MTAISVNKRSRFVDYFYASVLPVCARGLTILVPRTQIALPDNTVLLTFDDGPSEHVTPRLLRVLSDANISACFCVVGTHAHALPDITRQIVAEGHVIANHGYQHRFPLFLGRDAISRDIDQCDAILAEVLNQPSYRSAVYRPPGGWLLPHVNELVKTRALQIASISYFPMDHRYGPEQAQIVFDRCYERLVQERGGSVVFHEAVYGKNGAFCQSNNERSWLAEGMQQWITRLQDAGLIFFDAKTFFQIP